MIDPVYDLLPMLSPNAARLSVLAYDLRATEREVYRAARDLMTQIEGLQVIRVGREISFRIKPRPWAEWVRAFSEMADSDN